jgi:hypothetical protein
MVLNRHWDTHFNSAQYKTTSLNTQNITAGELVQVAIAIYVYLIF